MRFLHTADWHLGNAMFDIDRTSEFDSFFDWLKKEIIEKKIDLLIVAGDIFDTVNPPVVSRSQYNRFLASLIKTESCNVVIVGGNHDSGALLDSEKELLELNNIHVIGGVDNLSVEDMVFEVFNSKNDVVGICAAVPFARENELRKYLEENGDKKEDENFSDAAYGELYRKVFLAADKLRGNRKIPIVATGHLYAADLEGRFENLKNEVKSDDGKRNLDVVGNLGSVHAGVFPKGFNYVALGHVHYSTKVGKKNWIRYSGSPFTLGFDEANLPRHVLIGDVFFDDTKEVEIQKIEVPKYFEFRRISGDIKTIKSELKKYVEINSDKKDDVKKSERKIFIELNYKWEDGVNFREEFEEIVSELPENVCVVNYRLQDTKSIMEQGFGSLSMDELKNLDAEEIFKNLILSKTKDDDSLDEEEKSKRNEDLIKKYLPYFLKIASDVENGVPDENK